MKLFNKYLFSLIFWLLCINVFAQVKLDLYSGKTDTVYVYGYLFIVEIREKKNMDKMIDYYIIANNQFNKHIIKEDKLFKLDRNRDSVFMLCRGGAYLTLNDIFFKGELPIIEYPILFDVNKGIIKKDRKYFYRYYHIKAKSLVIYLTEKELIHVIPYEQYRFTKKTIPVFLLKEIELLD